MRSLEMVTTDRRRAVFIDRDGTLIEDTGFVRDAAKVEALLPGASAAIRRLNEAGLAVVVITNQSGIARGLLTRQDFEAVQERLVELLGSEGAQLDATYMCPHHPDVDGPCLCRKPGSALFRQAADEMSLDLSRSFYVGDRWRDVAVTAEVGGSAILVGAGPAEREMAPREVPDVANLAQAVDRILASLDGEV